ncbi:MAG: hypothetical protein ABS36_10335 [Acidobacteria bacterium SCN 69-37]|nr:MAG: hypothetical protein ABS36_10335 [Acidobacteria bacterium SCN 69-37]
MDYGRAIRVVRTAYGMSQAELADRLSIGASQLSLIESKKRNPSLDVLHEVAAVLQVPVHLLTLLASEPQDLQDPGSSPQVAEMATALLRVLTSGRPSEPHQATLPITKDE